MVQSATYVAGVGPMSTNNTLAMPIPKLSYSERLRIEVFSHYCGGAPRCQCPGCTVDVLDFLQLDHVNGDGSAHRKANNLGTGGARLWQWVKDNGYPSEFQVLCCNCNHSKFNGKACKFAGHPHCSSDRKEQLL